MYYKTLAIDKNKWFKLSLVEQMANVGSEVIRAINWRRKGDFEYSKRAIERALELLYLTIEDPKNKKFSRLKELKRVYEFLVDYFYFNNQYGSSDEGWFKYFYAFNYKANIEKTKGKVQNA
ncbi:MAG: hypothetical protein RMJ67_08125 [Elusimicrobiota bacterium]|nr:hypothetical protein [Endomicrobiia bacterium]MDW8166461.1 hypothetical protein [Elusimicrobiota bacterium]